MGGVSSSTRKATLNALAKLFEVVAPALGVEPDQLEAVDGMIRVKDNPNKSLTWKAACRKMGTSKISEMGENNQRTAAREGLNTSGAAGVQIADVSVDTETGIVKMNRYIAVQDCGMIINPRLAESQIYGAIIMGIGTALFEERIMDAQTGAHAESRHGILQAGRHQRHRRDHRAPGLSARKTISAASSDWASRPRLRSARRWATPSPTPSACGFRTFR